MRWRGWGAAAFALMLALGWGGPARAATYLFTQTYPDIVGNDPGVITVRLVGTDADSDGWIRSGTPGELTGLFIGWTGTGAFSDVMPAVVSYTFAYRLNGGPLGDDVGERLEANHAAAPIAFQLLVNPFNVNDPTQVCTGLNGCGMFQATGGIGSSTTEALQPVPEPAGLALLGLGLAALGAARRRRG